VVVEVWRCQGVHVIHGCTAGRGEVREVSSVRKQAEKLYVTMSWHELAWLALQLVSVCVRLSTCQPVQAPLGHAYALVPATCRALLQFARI
jgi:hypothetical protein